MSDQQLTNFEPGRPGANIKVPRAQRSWRAVLERLADQYVYVRQGNQFYCLLNQEFVSIESIKSFHAHEGPKSSSRSDNVALRLLSLPDLRRVMDVTYQPGGDLILKDGGVQYLNIWRAPKIIPSPGDFSWFLEHVAYVLDGNEIAIEYFCNYLAFLVQSPGAKVNSTPLIIGKQGIGKSMLADMMRPVLGPENVRYIGNSQLDSQFNGWAMGTQLVVVPELQSKGRLDLMNRLKPYITDPFLTLNEKFQRTRTVPNRINFILFSNHKDALSIEPGDRRFMVHISRANPKSPDYYNQLSGLMETHAPHLLHYLQSRDISEFDPHAPAPLSDSKVRIIEDGVTNLEAYFREAIELKKRPFVSDLVRLRDVVEFLSEKRLGNQANKNLSVLFENLGAQRFPSVKRIGDNYRRFWIVRNPEKWLKATESEIENYVLKGSDACDAE